MGDDSFSQEYRGPLADQRLSTAAELTITGRGLMLPAAALPNFAKGDTLWVKQRVILDGEKEIKANSPKPSKKLEDEALKMTKNLKKMIVKEFR